MLDISAPELLILIVAALFILGPQRLPEAARWLGRTTRTIRDYVTGARDQLAAEIGEDFAELRQVAQLRNLDVRAILLDETPDPVVGQPIEAIDGARPPFDPDAT